MSASFAHIVVSRTAEQAFRRRAIRAYPKEMMEAIWGRVKGDILHIHAFMPIDHKGRPAALTYEEDDLDEQETEAGEYRLELIGSIHTHPNCLDCFFSEIDLREVQEAQDTVMAVCAITQEMKNGKLRRSSEIVYWPAPRPMKVLYAP